MADDAPSKTQLLARRDEKALVDEGRSVLEDRRDLLAHMLVEQLRLTERLVAETGAELRHAGRLFRGSVMRHGIGGLTRLTGHESERATQAWVMENRLGVPFMQASPEALESTDGEMPESWAISLELAATLRALHRLLPLLLELAAAENNLLRLVDVFRRTQRRVNALEHIVLPDLARSIKDMEDRMDEMERDDLVRSLLVKRRIAQS